MNRILQIILGLIFIQYIVALVFILAFLPARIFNLSREKSESFNYPAGQQKFESSMALGPLKLSHTMEYDSILAKGVRNFYVGLPNLVASGSINSHPLIRNGSGESVIARYNEIGHTLEVPVTQSRYRWIMSFALILILSYLILLLYMMSQLYAFSKQAGRQEFFNAANQRRLRIFGAFIILTTVFSYVIDVSGVWILQQLSGTYGYRYLNVSKELGSFPTQLVAGLLMFIVASAFGKGEDLQTEQDLTI